MPTEEREQASPENEAFLQAFRGLYARRGLATPFSDKGEGKEPLRDAAVLLISKGNFDPGAEAEIVKIFLSEAFKFTQIGQFIELSPTQRWTVEFLREYFDFIKICRTRYAAIIPEDFWHEYILKIEQEARKHTEPDPQHTSIATSIEEKESLLALIEDINLILPLPDIEIHRQNIAARIRDVIMEDMETAYTTTSDPPARDIDKVRAVARKYGVEIPNELQYWEAVAAEIVTVATAAVEAMEACTETAEFTAKIRVAEDSIEKNSGKIRRAQEAGVPIYESITTLLQRINRAKTANRAYVLRKEVESIMAAIHTHDIHNGDAHESYDRDWRNLRALFGRIMPLGDRAVIEELATELIKDRVDPALKALGIELSQHPENVEALSDKIGKFKSLRVDLAGLIVDKHI